MRDGAKSHEFSELTILRWPKHKVEVIGHQAVGEQIDRHSVAGLGERSKELPVVIVMLKQLEPPCATVHDMEDQTSRSRHRSTRHDSAMFKIVAKRK